MTGIVELSKGLTVLHCVVYLQTLVRLTAFCPIAKIYSPLQGKLWLKEFRDVVDIPVMKLRTDLSQCIGINSSEIVIASLRAGNSAMVDLSLSLSSLSFL